ncbi:hypothetical protein H072_6425 [Dactylellina haptotyla CBS 200.50]|uniref:ATP-dependent DNA ligase family profile domain-containing protein n=1 Tax=Dactylellina haptotyla (strain CBS 200.50) TaxID=1284197 RepID=S8BX45_DACHA|nr:hypothetical protein H072_6425 [Dactylellina haptotyla CBS 200.50]
MPFVFSHVCDLLSTLEDLHLAKQPHNTSDLASLYKSHLVSWFTHFRPDLTPDLWVPLFSILWPQGRSDRVYGFKGDGLINAVSAAMCFGPSRVEELRGWRTLGRGDRDLGDAVERVFSMAENVVAPSNAVTITEIENALNELASHCRFSSSDIVRNSHKGGSASKDSNMGKKANGVPVRQFLLGNIYMRLSSRDAKWFTRTLLKSLLPVALEPDNLFREFHFLLPEIQQIRGELKSALSVLASKTFKLFPCSPNLEDKDELVEAGRKLLVPEIGVKVGRPVFVKAVNCERVFQVTKLDTWALERKYDGEYCQIHIDLTKGKDWLKIFSKSGRDSTQDRIGCHSIIRECLQLDSPQKRVVRQRCILEAELLVYSEKEDCIASFHTIRNHVMRAGTYIGTTLSSAYKHQSTEHIMLKFFDCILLDDICPPINSYNARRYHLDTLVKRIPNRAELVTRKVIDFSLPNARELFFETFAEGIAMKWEGFVMKPCEGRYVGWGVDKGNCWIKLKKDYIPGFGDSADFAIIGGRCGGARGIERGLDPSMANTFYAACLINKQEALTLLEKPVFKIVFTVSYNLTRPDLMFLKSHRYFHGVEYSETPATDYRLEKLDSHFAEPDFLFSTPLVLECFGAGFDKLDRSDYWTLRWPRVQKIHKDRGYLEAVTFQELQSMATTANTVSTNCSTEIREWGEKLKASTNKKRQSQRGAVEEPKGMLTRSFWEADSLTTKNLDATQWSPLKNGELSQHSSFQAAEHESPTLLRTSKRPLSQITGNSQSQAREVESQYCPRRAVSNSPLFTSRVYIMEHLLDSPEMVELLKTLEVSEYGSCKDLIASAKETLYNEEDEEVNAAILLVEERKQDEIRTLLGRFGKGSGERKRTVEVYSWRILKRMKRILEDDSKEKGSKRRRVTEDWSVMHLDTIS